MSYNTKHFNYRVVIAGSRSFGDGFPMDNYDRQIWSKHLKLLMEKMETILEEKRSRMIRIEIVSGCSRGADKAGEHYAQLMHFKLKKFPAMWDKYGKKAGPLRNERMAKYADAVVVFWDGKSRGTRHMMRMAEKYELPLRVIKF